MDITQVGVFQLKSTYDKLQKVFGEGSTRDQRVMNAAWEVSPSLPDGWTLYVVYDNWWTRGAINIALGTMNSNTCKLPSWKEESTHCTLAQLVEGAGGKWDGKLVDWSGVPEQGSKGTQLRYNYKQ